MTISIGVPPLLIGEVFVDFTVTAAGTENKLRLGGVTHAARGFWALGVPFIAAVVLPDYLEEVAGKFFKALGCVEFHVVGRVRGAPNVTVLFDQIELADQGYETLLRDEKAIELFPANLKGLRSSDVLIFPGDFDLCAVCSELPPNSKLHIDAAYDVDVATLSSLPQPIETILISTSSSLFKSIFKTDISDLVEAFKPCGSATLILKENRGGARMVVAGTQDVERLPAQLGSTANSVGVGDVFAAAYVVHYHRSRREAAWRASFAAAAYSQTTYPDLFKTYVERDLKLDLGEMCQLEGAFLPWEIRSKYSIYLAAPDFSYADRRAIERALSSLSYHNFNVRRPVSENEELPPDAPHHVLQQTYQLDYDLLKECALVFAVPTGKDPGTLVEIGIAIEAKIPVVVYDPGRENANTMVMAGAECYSADLDECLNSVFRILSRVAAG